MPAAIEWLGHDAFRLRGAGKVVYVDPYQLEQRHQPPADLILVTHDHFDHLDAGAIDLLRTPETVVAGPAGVVAQLPGSIEVKPGEERELAGLRVRVLPAYNVNKFRSPGEPFHPRGQGVGYLVELEGETVYHTGDSDPIPEMAGLQPDVALVPVSGTYVMTAEEAAEAVRAMRPGRAIPMHYGAIVGSEADARRFAEIAGVPVEILSRTS
jgi:L-ascorbate metabolism protein UlaG (beta-lactamase superfamily)